jgi:hypothetical protein
MHWMSEDYKLFVYFFLQRSFRKAKKYPLRLFDYSDFKPLTKSNKTQIKQLILHCALFLSIWCSIWAKSIEWFIEDQAFFLGLSDDWSQRNRSFRFEKARLLLLLLLLLLLWALATPCQLTQTKIATSLQSLVLFLLAAWFTLTRRGVAVWSQWQCIRKQSQNVTVITDV